MAPVVVLFVCTANICRSPMAAALLGLASGDGAASDAPRGAPAGRRRPLTITSAGLLEGGHPASPEVVTVMHSYGVDLSDHRSTRITAEAVGHADLILAMERRHAREAVLLDPSALSRTFTVKDFVRRAEKVGARPPGQPLGPWLWALGGDRDRTDLIGRAPEDEVADPLGGPLADYRATAGELADLVGRTAGLLWSDAGRADS